MSHCSVENCNGNIHCLGFCYKHYQKNYHDKHKHEKREYDKQYRIRNQERLNELKKQYYRNNKQRLTEDSKLRFQRDKEKIYARTNEWRRRNPQKVIQYWLNHLNKYSKPFNIESRKFGWLLTLWGKNVRKRDNNQCQICGTADDLHSHHILPKENHPKL